MEDLALTFHNADEFYHKNKERLNKCKLINLAAEEGRMHQTVTQEKIKLSPQGGITPTVSKKLLQDPISSLNKTCALTRL